MHPYKKMKLEHIQDTRGEEYTEERPCEKRARRWPSASQKESPREKPTQTNTDQISSLQNYRKCEFLLFKPLSMWLTIAVLIT